MSNVSAGLLGVVRAQLTQGEERLAWALCPEPAAFAPRTRRKGWDAAVILGGGYATISAIVMAARSGRWLWLTLPLPLIVLGGLAYAVARWRRARRLLTIEGTVYALTTRRALIVRSYPALSVQALPIESIADITIGNPARGLGDLSFQSASQTTAMVFRGVFDPELARTQLLKIVRDPEGTDRQIAASERYRLAMAQLARRGL